MNITRAIWKIRVGGRSAGRTISSIELGSFFLVERNVMLQFLVGIRLPDCTYHIPRRRITGDSICDEYSIRSGKFRSLYYMSSRSVEFNLTFTPLALVTVSYTHLRA